MTLPWRINDKCGLVGQGLNNYSRRSSGGLENPSPPHCNDLRDRIRQEVRDNSGSMIEGMEAGMNPRPADTPGEIEVVDDPSNTDYGP